MRGRPAGAPAGPAGLEFFFERDLEDALLQQEVGDHLLELLIVLLERAQSLGVRVGHHAQLLLPAVEGRGGDVELPADFGLAPPGLVLADGPYPGLLRVAFLAHLMRYVLGVWLGWQPRRYQFNWHILTGPTQRHLVWFFELAFRQSPISSLDA